MIRKATPANEAAILAAAHAAPITGTLCEMHWHLWRQNPHMPHRFFLLDSGAVITLCGYRAKLCGAPQTPAESEELESFLAFSGVKHLASVNWHPLGWPVREDACIMMRPAGKCTTNRPLPDGFDPLPPVDDVLSVLESSIGRMRPEDAREGFWVDFHIRRNHGVSLVYGLWENGMLAATAGAYAITQNTAYIACVETRPASRGKGYASALLARLCDDLPGRALSLICRNKLAPFYEKHGFANSGQRKFMCLSPTAPSERTP